jgi:uncharacterized RDD family membrane protein YckC
VSSDYASPVSATIYPTSYAGFWRRLLAVLVDYLLVVAIFGAVGGLLHLTAPDAIKVFEGVVGFVLTQAGSAGFCLYFWVKYGATPGKMALGIRVVCLETGEAPPLGMAVLRYLGYILSAIPLGLGFLWAAWDPRKQGWHDKIADTVVVRVNH